MNSIQTFEAQLLAWYKSTSKNGPKIVLQLRSDEDIEFFELLTLAKGKIAGQILDIAVSLSDQDDQSKEVEQTQKEKPKHRLSTDAALLCKEPKFWDYTGTDNEDQAAQYVRSYCKIKSRSELETNGAAAYRFKLLHSGYSEWVKGNR